MLGRSVLNFLTPARRVSPYGATATIWLSLSRFKKSDSHAAGSQLFVMHWILARNLGARFGSLTTRCLPKPWQLDLMFAQTSFCLSHFLPSCLFDSFYVFALDVKGLLGCNVSCNLFGKKLWLKPHGKAKAQWIPPEITGLFIIFTNRFFQAEKNIN